MSAASLDIPARMPGLKDKAKVARPSGARLQVVGIARTRELEILNSIAGCRWKWMPV